MLVSCWTSSLERCHVFPKTSASIFKGRFMKKKYDKQKIYLGKELFSLNVYTYTPHVLCVCFKCKVHVLCVWTILCYTLIRYINDQTTSLLWQSFCWLVFISLHGRESSYIYSQLFRQKTIERVCLGRKKAFSDQMVSNINMERTFSCSTLLRNSRSPHSRWWWCHSPSRCSDDVVTLICLIVLWMKLKNTKQKPVSANPVLELLNVHCPL